MELYHLHTKNNHDRLWKEKKEIVIDKKFNNRLYNRCMNFNVAVDINNHKELTEFLNYLLLINNFEPAVNTVNLNELLQVYLSNKEAPGNVTKLLKDCERKLSDAMIFKREMALENYRLENVSNLPSRLHSIYATDEDGINYWSRLLIDGDLEVFRIETYEEPFQTSESLLPMESLTYKDAYSGCFSYWHPNLKKCNNNDYEYLVKGKVKILEKVDEIKKK